MPAAEAPRNPLALLLRTHVVQSWRQLKSVREQSRLLTSVIGLFIIGYLLLSFALFSKGLQFVAGFPGLGVVLTERMLYLLFAFLFGLLLLSNLVISYTNLFRHRETTWLLTLPVPNEIIFRWKFIESTLLASWAFLFLIAPLLLAYGLTRQVPWYYYPGTALAVALFIVLPGVIGAWLAIALGRWLDRRSFQVAIVLGSIAMLVRVAFWWHAEPVTDDLLESRVLDVLDQLLVKTNFALYPFLPSYWLSATVLQWAEGAVSAGLFFLLVLLSNALFFGFATFTRAGALFYDTVSAVQSRAGAANPWASSGPKAGNQPGWLEKIVLFPGLTRDVRALLVKDARMFWRDTTQWGQSVMLFGLLGVYVINLRHFTHQLSNPFWVNLVSYLNLGACSLNLATLSTRFVYPQFSLEGRRLWIVGMAPLGLRRVVQVKYWLASIASLSITLTLILLSCGLLRMSWDRMAFFGSVITLMTFSLNGLAVGLGVLYPNFKETNPTKIVSGFGGTLCLVLSFLYILASVLLLAFGTGGFHGRAGLATVSILLFAALSALVGGVPLSLGLRRVKHFEF
jgi:ABC-2 type transport system permease protein